MTNATEQPKVDLAAAQQAGREVPTIEVAYTEPQIGGQMNYTPIENIRGRFAMMAGAPTYTPRGFADSIVLDTSTGTLYVYDFTNNAWNSYGGGAFGGKVNSGGTAAWLPTGWSVSISSGQYTLTHNLGTTNYGWAATPVVTGDARINVLSVGANSLTFEWLDSLNNTTQLDWYFTLVLTT